MANVDAPTLNKRVSGLERNRPPPHWDQPLRVASEVITSAAVIGDVLRFMRLPAGSTLYDAWLLAEAGVSTDAIADFGYTAVSGTAANTDVDYFAATLVPGVTEFNRALLVLPPVVVTDDVYITVTLSSDGLDASKWLRATVFYTLPVA